MKQTTDELKKIIENAPEGATHYQRNGEYKYWKLTYICGYQAFTDNRKALINRMPTKIYNLRSLSDIREIIELRERLEDAKDYLDSFIETESKKDHRCQECGQFDDSQVNFNEAIKALDMLEGCDDDE